MEDTGRKRGRQRYKSREGQRERNQAKTTFALALVSWELTPVQIPHARWFHLASEPKLTLPPPLQGTLHDKIQSPAEGKCKERKVNPAAAKIVGKYLKI